MTAIAFKKIGSIFPPVIKELQEFLANPEFHPDDVKLFQEWLSLKDPSFFKGKTLEEILSWTEENLLDDLALLRVAESLKSIAGIPSESDLEDAYNWVDSTTFNGSAKQVKWAKDIAHKNHEAIVLAWKQGKKIPTEAKWWIENRANIVVSLP